METKSLGEYLEELIVATLTVSGGELKDYVMVFGENEFTFMRKEDFLGQAQPQPPLITVTSFSSDWKAEVVNKDE
jgi:hypothetical protein